MLRIIMDACNIRHFGVCDASRLSADAQGSVIAVLFPHKLADGTYADNLKARQEAHNILSVACQALTRAFGPYDFTAYLDDSPFTPEIAAAACGLGAIGRPGWFISSQYGTDCFIGIITSHLYFPPTGSEIERCEDCGKCDGACPAPGECAYPNRIHNLPEMPDCTLCRKACPHNTDTPETYISSFH